jgi:hypothetical protein
MVPPLIPTPEVLCRRPPGYGSDVDLDALRAWWSLRSLRAARWLML